jgi:hypothetical protein
MTTTQLQDSIEDYGRGVAAQLSLLDELAHLASRQHQAVLARDSVALDAAAADRDRILARVLALEDDLRPQRELLAQHLADANQLRGFAAVQQLHRLAEQRLADVIALDDETCTRLEGGDSSRRATAHALDAGEATLSAYRRIVSPAPSRSGIVDQRG